MKLINLQILGKLRELVLEEDSIAYLNRRTDAEETGIYCGLTISDWKNESLLERIRPE